MIIDHWLIWVILTILVLNTVSALITVFHRPRNIVTTWAWILVLLLLPVIGFLIYAFFGRGIAQEKIFSISNQEHIGLSQLRKIADEEKDKNQKSSRYDETYYARHVISF